ncbi:hypothetical protein SEA_LUCKYSOCKE_161 [Streptomyces phage LuckySocke]|jgi:hypothetical protein|nr:hypothetical protein SEA_ALONE_163 [Streptomyces phage Alone3]WPH58907.1 hypothetical protein SEA_LUCKYSOCKE_161 [Streptomyces phage LuckySocke]
MPAKNEQYRLKKIKGVWYTVEEVKGNCVILKDCHGHQTLVSIETLNKNYTKEK